MKNNLMIPEDDHMNETCPCGSGAAYEACCQPIHAGEKDAVTAAELMKARYAAFVRADIDFLRRSYDPRKRKQFNEEDTRRWATGSDWRGFEIVSTEEGGVEDDRGRVEFIARYAVEGKELEHHEMAVFRKDDGVWYFVDGRVSGAGPVVRATPKTGRNDPCPCGSGKKHKKCCGG